MTKKHWSKIAFVTQYEAKKISLNTLWYEKLRFDTCALNERSAFRMSGIESCIDNLIVFSNYGKTHLKTFEKLLRRVSEANFTARPSKRVFEASTASFSGHDIEYDWVTPNDDNLDIIARAKRPVTKKKTRLFYWLLGYYGD